MTDKIKENIELIKELVDYIDDITPKNQSKTDHLGQIILCTEKIISAYEKNIKEAYNEGYKIGKDLANIK